MSPNGGGGNIRGWDDSPSSPSTPDEILLSEDFKQKEAEAAAVDINKVFQFHKIDALAKAKEVSGSPDHSNYGIVIQFS